ncbi:fluoride efflux transporter FluC [Nocardioides sp. Iso805N]|uniref:fluoride efflux transporter FluC n=1 Tax=Nocardioides sp. Iso805N TaxID=1283287 RepID=UPI0003612611|nr:CrcB family protein [Nocardioides sp. Iso805N]
MSPSERLEDPDRIDPDVDCDVELTERPSPHPWQVLNEHVHLVPAIAVGGALGSLARFGLAKAAPHAAGDFAWATLATNLSGAFLLGLLMALMLTIWSHTRYVRPFLGVGVLGGYTTFSTYELDTRGLLAAGHPAEALAYVAATVALGLVAVLAGLGLGRVLVGRSGSGARR